MKTPSLAIFACAALASCTAGAMTTQVYQANLYDRYYVGGDKAFIGQPYDWSGVARSPSHGPNPWATMISPSYFISVNHNYLAAGESVTFHLDNNPAGPTYTVGGVGNPAQVDSWSFHPTMVGAGPPYDGLPSDIRIGRFTQPVPAGVAIYPILAYPDPLTDYHDGQLWVYGAADNVGLNLVNNPFAYSDVAVDVSPAPPAAPTGATSILIYNNDAGFAYPSAGGAETMLAYGDSGAPTFMLSGGQLALVGVHLGIGEGAEATLEADTFVPWYIAQIDAAIRSASGGTEFLTIIVPEPASAALLLAGALGLLSRRRPARRPPASV